MEMVSQALVSILIMVSMAGCLARTPVTEPTFAVFEERSKLWYPAEGGNASNVGPFHRMDP